MIVSHKHKLIFLHNPKTAGTWLRSILGKFHDDEIQFWSPNLLDSRTWLNGRLIDIAHVTLAEFNELRTSRLGFAFSKTHPVSDYHVVCVVRDPYKRFVSALNEFKKKNPELLRGNVDVRPFIKHLSRASIVNDCRYVHFRPQVMYAGNLTSLSDLKIVPEDLHRYDGHGVRFTTSQLPELVKYLEGYTKTSFSENTDDESDWNVSGSDFDWVLDDEDVISKINFLYHVDFTILDFNKRMPFAGSAYYLTPGLLSEVDVAELGHNVFFRRDSFISPAIQRLIDEQANDVLKDK